MKKTYTAKWEYIPDPLFITTCPKCKQIIFMSTPSVIEKLKKWRNQLFKTFKK